MLALCVRDAAVASLAHIWWQMQTAHMRLNHIMQQNRLTSVAVTYMQVASALRCRHCAAGILTQVWQRSINHSVGIESRNWLQSRRSAQALVTRRQPPRRFLFRFSIASAVPLSLSLPTIKQSVTAGFACAHGTPLGRLRTPQQLPKCGQEHSPSVHRCSCPSQQMRHLCRPQPPACQQDRTRLRL